MEECQKLVNSPVSSEELVKAKEHHVGHLYMNLETTDSLAEFYAEEEVVNHKLKSPYDIDAEIRKVTAKDVMRAAKEIFKNENLNLAIVGNIGNQQAIKKVLTFK